MKVIAYDDSAFVQVADGGNYTCQGSRPSYFSLTVANEASYKLEVDKLYHIMFLSRNIFQTLYMPL
jgi:hypothetical protein